MPLLTELRIIISYISTKMSLLPELQTVKLPGLLHLRWHL